MNYIHVRSLDKYHIGYKDRKLIWAKIYFNMVQGDPDCEMITNEIDWGRLIKFILLELQARKPIPLDEKYLSRKGFDLKARKIELTLQALSTFIELKTETVTEPLQPCNAEKRREYKEEDIKKSREDTALAPILQKDLEVKKYTTPQAIMVENFKTLYQALSNQPYNDIQSDYILMDKLLKKHGSEAVIKKIGTLGQLCKSGAQWFTKAGWADLTIGKLSKFWNEILPVESEEEKKKRKDAEIKKKTEAASEYAKQCVETVRSAKYNNGN